MFETKGQVVGNLYGTLQGFCHAVSASAKRDARHSVALSRLIKAEYFQGFYPSLRVFTKMREVLERSYAEALDTSRSETGHFPQKIELFSAGGKYFLRWAEEGFIITLMIPRGSLAASEFHIVGSDIRTVRTCATYVGLLNGNITYTSDTKMTLKEVANLNWNESARIAMIPMWEWQALLSKYSSK
ncbi:MAG: hypothetical protein V4473_02150 [Patescibacteria group bacterium]